MHISCKRVISIQKENQRRRGKGVDEGLSLD